MKVQAQVSLYPLRMGILSAPVREFCEMLKGHDLRVDTQSMSTFIAGELDVVFQAVREAFQVMAAKYDVVMALKVSNTCPDDPERSPREKGGKRDE